jgi:coproporphyrinogen III oxidase
MAENLAERKARASAWFRSLRNEIVAAFETLEDEGAARPGDAGPGRFEVTETRRTEEGLGDAGGGLMSVMRGGRVFEKVGVNVSTVHGTLRARAQAGCRGSSATRGSGPAGSALSRTCRTRMCRPST